MALGSTERERERPGRWWRRTAPDTEATAMGESQTNYDEYTPGCVARFSSLKTMRLKPGERIPGR